MNGVLLNLDGSRFVKDQIENSDLTIPMTTPTPQFLISQTDDDDDDYSSSRMNPKRKRLNPPLFRHYAHVCGVNMNETILENAEICGTNLAVKLLQMGADSILAEIREKVTIIPI
jgi:hypothetical protein